MQLERPYETFEITGPQLEVFGEVESKLPAPAKKPSFAAAVLAVAVLLSVFGTGGAQLKARYDGELTSYSAVNAYGYGIQTDFAAQADAAASLIRIAGGVLGEDHADVRAAQSALDGWNAGNDPREPSVQFACNRALYGAVDGLYNSARLHAEGDAAERIEGLYATFVSAQATIDRAGARYNEAAREYNKTASGFPANLTTLLWGGQALPLFAG